MKLNEKIIVIPCFFAAHLRKGSKPTCQQGMVTDRFPRGRLKSLPPQKREALTDAIESARHAEFLDESIFEEPLLSRSLSHQHLLVITSTTTSQELKN